MQTQSSKLHLGCGLVTPAGWLNVDGSFNARVARFPVVRKSLAALGVISKSSANVNWAKNVVHHDVRKRLPWRDGSFEAVYASHLLEHLHLSEGMALLRECHRVLRPGGVIRIVVPDLESAIRDYVERREHAETYRNTFLTRTRADELNSRMLFHEATPVPGGFAMRTFRLHNAFHQHKWMYDAESLSAHLSAAGFREVARRGFLESRISTISEVESRARVEDGGLAVEGVKAS